MAHTRLLLEDDFSGLEAGNFSAEVGAHTEYHYLPEAAPKGNWAVACFSSGGDRGRAWQVQESGAARLMAQTIENRYVHTHPTLVCGDPLWGDLTATIRFTPQRGPEAGTGQAGLVFRYRNSRCYYFFGLSEDGIVLKMVRHATAYRKPYEEILAQSSFAWQENHTYTASVSARGRRIRAEISGPSSSALLEADDGTYPEGRVGILADMPTQFHSVRIETSAAAVEKFNVLRSRRERELDDLRADNPKPVLWKKFKTPGFGVGRNLRFGDLSGDGQTDLLVGQMLHHGPRDQYSELSCLTAMNFDGEILWQIGRPDPENYHLTNDVGFQIHDIDGDGRNEVIYCMNFEIIVLDGATGQVKLKAPTPSSLPPANRYPRILGDCLFFCDLRGLGQARDMIIKDRYWNFWALDDQLKELWQGACNTGHYPFAFDVDGDGHDELAIGYCLYDHDGQLLWTLEDQLKDHADGIAIADFSQSGSTSPTVFYTASDEGVVFASLEGQILKHHYIGHAQNPAIANFRPDLPGLEAVTINFWGNQGILHFFDAEGNIYHDCEPNPFGSMCLPINWTGQPGEYFVHSPNVTWGGMFDGWGRPVVQFPDDGHPDMCNAVLDLTGDCRDEVVVWDPHEVWVYTQDDNPKPGRLYKPVRNPLYNYSNYQASVSLPGYSE